jgi:transposase
MAKEQVVMSVRELVRVDLLVELSRGKRTTKEVADLLGVSERTIRRQAERFESDGLTGLLHRNRGRAPVNKRTVDEEQRILLLLKEKYFDFNVSHARFMLETVEGITVSYGSLRSLMLKLGPLKKGKRRRKQARQQRDRMPRFGMLLQMDGSPHRWNGRDVWCCIGAIDDATSTFLHAEFFNGETTLNCMRVLQTVVEKYGIPSYLYVDRAGLYGGHKRQEFAQFQRACQELGIKIIFANSAQAKGRIERAWNTLQDRLVAELRLHGIREMAEANRYLRDTFLSDYWNTHLTVRPEQSGAEFRKCPEELNLDDVFSIRFSRTVSNCSTVSIDGHRYRMVTAEGDHIPVCARCEIVIRQDGSMHARVRGVRLSLEKVRMPPKEPMRRLEPCAKGAASDAPGEGTRRSREGSPQAQAKAAPKPASDAHGDSAHPAGGECPMPPLGARIGGKFVPSLNPRHIRPKRRLDKVA